MLFCIKCIIVQCTYIVHSVVYIIYIPIFIHMKSFFKPLNITLLHKNHNKSISYKNIFYIIHVIHIACVYTLQRNDL